MPQRISPSKLAAEFLVIFVSVILALLADDWRANQLLIKEERRVLEAMVKDLQADRENLTFFSEELLDIQEHTVLALEGLMAEDTPDPETWVPQAMRGTTLWLYRPTYPTYRGLTQSGRLSLIRDPALRERIVDYHDDMVDYLVDLRENAVLRSDRVRATMLPYILWTPTSDNDWHTVLAGDFDELRADRIFRGHLSRYGRTVNWLGKRIDQLFIPSNTEMTEVILAYLEGRPLPPATEKN